jgi:tRNA-modifying protein YgfZ
MFISNLADRGLLLVSGEDAQSFLHAQFTNDVSALTFGISQYGGYCTPKGRLLASFLMWRGSAGYFLQLPAVLRDPLQKRLSMYILRSKVKVADAGAEYAHMGITGNGAEEVLRGIAGGVPGSPNKVMHADELTILRLPADRYEIVMPSARQASIRALLTPHALQPPTPDYWDWMEICSGIATILPPTQQEFVPQMVNFDAIGAVSFKKGCYPGQEIVARMHYLGRLKQRMVRAHVASGVPQPGDKLYSAVFGEQSCGMVVNAAQAPRGGYDMLAVVQTDGMSAEPVRLGAPAGPALELLPLPYTV